MEPLQKKGGLEVGTFLFYKQDSFVLGWDGMDLPALLSDSSQVP